MTDEQGTSLSGEINTVMEGAIKQEQEQIQQQTSWYENVKDPELRKYVESTGYKDIDGLAQAARNGRQLISQIKGSPERVLMMPKDWDNQEEVGEFYSKLGRPADPNGYGLIKEGEQPDEVTQWFSEKAFKSGLSEKAAKEMFGEFKSLAQTISEKQEAARNEEWARSVEQDKEAIRKEWGMAYDAKIQAARSAALDFPELNDPAIERALGTAKFFKLMASLGEKVGEDKALGLGNNGMQFGKTPAQAQAELKELQMDKAFIEALYDRSHAGHEAAKAKQQRLSKEAWPE